VWDGHLKEIKPLPKKLLEAFESKVGSIDHSLPDQIAKEFKSSITPPSIEEDDPLGPKENYHRAVCAAVGIPYELDGTKTYHHIGNLDIKSSIDALNALVQIYSIQRNPRNAIFGYDHYLDACKRVGQIQRQIDSVHSHRDKEEERYHQHNEKAAKWEDSDAEKRGPAPNFYDRPEPEMPPIVDVEFLETHDLAEYRQNIEGYITYLKNVACDLCDRISDPIPLYVEDNPDRPHGYVVGTPGAGKSELLKLLVHTYVNNGANKDRNGSVVVLDPTTDLVSEISKWKEFIPNDRLVYICPNLQEGMTPVINPFEIDGIDPNDFSEKTLIAKTVVAQQLAECIERIVTSTVSPQMSTILTNCILVLLDREGSTLEDLFRFVKGDEDLVEFASGITHNEHLANYFSSPTSGFAISSNRSTKEAILRRLDELLSIGTFKRLTCGKSTINLVKEVNDRKVILIDLGKGSIGKKEGAAFGRLIIGMLLGMAFRRASQEKRKRVPCSLIVDECHNYLSESIEEILVEARKFRLLLTLAQQTAGQKMPHDLKDAVLTTTNFQVSGGTTRAGAKRNADLVGVTDEDILRLEIGEFFFRPKRSLPAIKFNTRKDLLDAGNSISDSTWKIIAREQLKKHYRRYAGAPTESVAEEPDTSPQKWSKFHSPENQE